MNRPLCKNCSQKPASINYKRKGKTYYRKKCDSCIRKVKNMRPPVPNWSKAGYKKKLICDKCAFKARWLGQIVIYYVDGNMNNVKLANLKSVCLNCTILIEKGDIPWTREVSPDN